APRGSAPHGGGAPARRRPRRVRRWPRWWRASPTRVRPQLVLLSRRVVWLSGVPARRAQYRRGLALSATGPRQARDAPTKLGEVHRPSPATSWLRVSVRITFRVDHSYSSRP